MYGRSTLPADASGGMPSTPVTDKRRPPGAVEHQLGRGRSAIGVMPSHERELVVDLVAEDLAPCASPARGGRAGISTCSAFELDLAGGFVLEPRSSWRRMRKLDGTTPEASPECTPSSSTSTVRLPPARPRSDVVQPQLVVVAAARVEAHDQRRLADARRRGGRRRTAGRSCRIPRRPRSGRRSARAAMPCCLQRLDRGERAEDRVAVVGAAAAVEPVALEHRLPRARGRRPSRSSPAACRGGRRAARVVARRAVGAGISMKISGVRPGRRTTSSVMPGDRLRRAPTPRISSTARSMWPCSAQSASNIGDLFGMRMYSMSCGTMSSSHLPSMKCSRPSASMVAALATAGARGRDLVASMVARSNG